MTATQPGSRSAPSTIFAVVAIVVFVGLVAVRTLWVGNQWLLHASDAVYLVSLSAALFALVQVARAVGSGDAAAVGWKLLAAAAGAYVLGQVALTGLRLTSETGALPFPSLADGLFVAGQVLVIAGLILQVIAYKQTGLPLGGRGSLAAICAVVAVAAVWSTLAGLIPLWGDPGKPTAEKALMTTYVALDLVMMTAAASVLRIALAFRGGSIAKGWAAIAVGFASMFVGDTFYAMGADPLPAFWFLAAYTLVAYGALRHEEVITGI